MEIEKMKKEKVDIEATYKKVLLNRDQLQKEYLHQVKIYDRSKAQLVKFQNELDKE